jgi:hypothetical protein
MLCVMMLSVAQTVKSKVKVYSRTGCEGPEGEWRYSSTVPLTWALDGGGWSMPRPGCFSLGKKTWHPLRRRKGGPQDQSGWVQKMSPTLGFDSWTVQPVQHY